MHILMQRLGLPHFKKEREMTTQAVVEKSNAFVPKDMHIFLVQHAGVNC
jgi:hypothetical protein